MIYQLPTGKIIELDVDDVLNIDKESMQYLLSCDVGMHVSNPFYKSNVRTPGRPNTRDESAEDYYKDYFPEEYDQEIDPSDFSTDI